MPIDIQPAKAEKSIKQVDKDSFQSSHFILLSQSWLPGCQALIQAINNREWGGYSIVAGFTSLIVVIRQGCILLLPGRAGRAYAVIVNRQFLSQICILQLHQAVFHAHSGRIAQSSELGLASDQGITACESSSTH